jgi:hypothetical protein
VLVGEKVLVEETVADNVIVGVAVLVAVTVEVDVQVLPG